MAASTRAQLVALLNSNVLTGGNRTTAQGIRDFENSIIESLINHIDDVNIPEGYLGINAFGNVNVSFIKAPSGFQFGNFLRDDGTWQPLTVSIPTLQQVVTSGNLVSGMLAASPDNASRFYLNGAGIGTIMQYDDGSNNGQVRIRHNSNQIEHSSLINLVAPSIDVYGNISMAANKYIYGGTGQIDFYTNTGVALTSDNGGYVTPYIWSDSVNTGFSKPFAGFFEDGLNSKMIQILQGNYVDVVDNIGFGGMRVYNDRTLIGHSVANKFRAPNNDFTGNVSMVSSDTLGEFYLTTSAQLTYDNKGIIANNTSVQLIHGTLIEMLTPNVRFPQESASRVSYFDASKNLKSSSITDVELGYLSGALSNIQNQINNLGSGLSWKTSARVLAGTNINIASPGAAIDGVTMAVNDRVVLNGQSTGHQNGVYVWNGSAVPMTRATDCDSSAELIGMTIAIDEGTSADQIWILTTNAPITVGTTTLTYAKSSATTYTASNGVTLTGNNFTLDNGYFSGAFTLSGGVATIGAGYVTNAMLVNSSTTINGTAIALGASGTITAMPLGTIAAGSVVVYNSLNTPTEANSTTGNKSLINDSGVISWATVTGTGSPVRATSPTLVTPTLGVASGTSLALTTFLEITEQSAPSTPTNAIRIFADTSNRFSWIGENGFTRTFDGTANTANWIYVLQNKSGTIAHLDDITGSGNIPLSEAISQLNNPPAHVSGERYLVNTVPTGAWVGFANNIAESNGTSWTFTAPILNNTVYLTSTAVTFKYNGTLWVMGGATPILQNGNSVGQSIKIGTNDAFDLVLKRNNITRFTVTATDVVLRNAANTFNCTLTNAVTANSTITLPPVTTTLAGKTGTPVAGYIAWWSDVNQVTSNSKFTVDNSNGIITCSGALNNASGALKAINSVGGTTAYSYIRAESSTGTNIETRMFSSTYTTIGLLVANSAAIIGSGNVVKRIDVLSNSAGVFSWAIGGTATTNEYMALADGLFAIKNSAMRMISTTANNNNVVTNNKILKVDTTDATVTELTTDGAAGSGATNRISVPSGAAMSVVVNVCVKQSGSANSKQMLRQFLITNNAGTTTIEGTVTALGTDVGSAALTTVSVTITANDTNDCIKIEGTGLAATNLRWTAFVVSTEVLYT